jgi:peptidoglycan hydrolase-like protein with peptidoglycan-binding domain
MNTVLKLGSRGDDVRTLQTTLNTALNPSPRLVPDGSFGGLTRSAVLRFQQANWLVEDGEAGPCTWNALMGTESYRPILHTIPFLAQPTNTTCWATSTAMVTRTTVQAVIARTPNDLILADGSLANFSETNDPMTGSRRFARANFMTVIPPTSWMPSALMTMLSRGPLVFDMLWDSTGYVQGVGSSGHMIAVVGIRGDNDQSGKGTTLRIFDPWPPMRGKKYSVGYFKWIQEVPTRTYHIYHKVG